MGEALMFRAGGGNFDGSNAGGDYELCTQIFESNGTFTMPDNVKDGQVHVRIFGGGGAGGTNSQSPYDSGGGCGGYMNNGWVSLGSGSTVQVTIGKGGASSYFNASSGGTTSFGTFLSANGGDKYSNTSCNGGSGGGGGGYMYSSYDAPAGNGIQFGAGGVVSRSWLSRIINGNMGGPPGNNGINTIGIIDEFDGINNYGVGYGVGGLCLNNSNNNYYASIYGGGGGYGANGGKGFNTGSSNARRVVGACGGGGGYGAAGYGGDGKASYTISNQTSYMYSGGGGAYGHGGTYDLETPTYGGGGACKQSGASGICIIHYYKKR